MRYTPWEEVRLSRHPGRPHTEDYINALFTDFFQQRGDRRYRDDASILGGIALFHGEPVTVIGHQRGKNLEENLRCNFGMPCPEGYRKAKRLMRLAEKFRRPVITFVDTPGAYPGKNAEELGQAEAIASCLTVMCTLTVPTIAVITGEGGSGGALALAAANRVLMLEHATYSVTSPEGFASILWKEPSRAKEASILMKATAWDLYHSGIVHAVLSEPEGGAHTNWDAVFRAVDTALRQELAELEILDGHELALQRCQMFRQLGGNSYAGRRYDG